MSDPDVRLAGAWAIERARFTAILTPRDGGESTTHHGGYIVTWRRGLDERWAIDRYIDDSG